MDSLNELVENEEAIIIRIDLPGSIKRRLLDIGLIPGTKIKYLFCSPFKEPKAYEVRKTIIALRDSETKNIYIEKLGDNYV